MYRIVVHFCTHLGEAQMSDIQGPYQPVTVGMDVGNATTSGVVIGEKERTSFFPSLIASVGVQAYDGMERVASGHHHILYRGTNYVVGEEAIHEMGFYSLRNELAASAAWTRYVGNESIACFLAGVASMFPDVDVVSIDLGTGAPLSMYQAHGKEIRKVLRGEHEFSYNGHQRKVLVNRVECYGEGREVLRLVPREERMGKIAVYDLGGRTLNTVFFLNGAEKRVVTKDFGIDRLFQRLPSIDRDLAVQWQIMREMRESSRNHQDVREGLLSLLSAALDIIAREVALGLAERHYVIGGGAFLLAQALKAKKFGSVRILHEHAPEAANAKAYALAMRGEGHE